MAAIKSIKHKSFLIAATRKQRDQVFALLPADQDDAKKANDDGVDGTEAPDIFPHSHNFHVPFFITIISIIELSVFLFHTIDLTTKHNFEVTSSGPTPICSALIYDPRRRHEPWRLFTYMLVHSGYVHIATNILVQLMLGMPLEIVHGPLRIGAVYLAGVLTGSLMTSTTDPGSFLAGASGGVYALMIAHLPSLIMNWREMKTFFEWFVSILVLSIGLVDFAMAIYHRYMQANGGDTTAGIGYTAHIGGGAAGFLVGMNILRNFEHKKWEGYLRLACFLGWIFGLMACILANTFNREAYPSPNRSGMKTCQYYN